MNTHISLRRLAAGLVVVLASAGATGQTAPAATNELTVEQLKSAYLVCNGAALAGRLGSGDIAQCSLVYEDLKQRAFGNDFEQLLAWSRAQRAAQSAAR